MLSVSFSKGVIREIVYFPYFHSQKWTPEQLLSSHRMVQLDTVDADMKLKVEEKNTYIYDIYKCVNDTKT